MIVGGLSFTGAPARTFSPSAPDSAPSSAAGHDAAPATYFRSISAISPGSLAGAYQAIRALETVVAPPVPAGEPAILSGLGVPAALAAYGEFAADD